MADNSFRKELRSELTKLLLKSVGIRLISGLLSFLAVGAWVFLGLIVWTALTNQPPVWQTLAVSRTALVIAALLFGFFVVFPILRLPSLGRLTREVESRKDLQDILEAGYEFSQRDDVMDRYAPELVREVIRQAVRSVGGLEAKFLFLERRNMMLVPVAYAALVALIVIALASPATIFDTGARVMSPRTAGAVDNEANLFASPGSITVLSGSDVEVSATDFGGSDDPVEMSYNLSGEFWKTEPTEPTRVLSEGSAPITKHIYTFEDIRNTVTYYFQSGDRKSREFTITVVNKPIVTDLEIVLTPPAYTGELPDTLIDSGGNIQALEGTDVAVRATSNNELSGAWVQFDDGNEQPVDVAGAKFDFDFAALRDGTYSIRLEDALSHMTDEPLVYSVEVYQDNPPVLDVIEPGGDATLPRTMRIDVAFAASDDYGVSQADIYSRKAGDESFIRTRVPLGDSAGEKDVTAAITWSLENIALFPGEYIEYFIQVEDNNIVTGPGITKSRMFNITVPTMAELYENIQEEEANRNEMFADAMKETEEFKERMEKLSREFKKSEELDWAQKKEIDKAIQSQDDIQEKLSDIQKSLEETMQSLSDNKMTSQEIGEKMEQIQSLIDEIDDEALNEYIEELREAMKEMNPEDIAKALEDLNMSAEDILKSLERTQALLEQIQQEQKMEEMVRKTQDLMNEQDALNDETDATDSSDSERMDELAQEQEDLAKKLDELTKDMERMSEEMSEKGNEEMSEQMGEMSEQTQQNETKKKMQEASESLEQGDKQQAQQQQEQAMEDLIALFSMMAQAQGAMQMQSQQRVAENLQRLANNTLELSFKQERLTQRLREQVAADGADGSQSLAREQHTYAKAVEQIAGELDALSKQSLAVPDFLLQGLGETLNNMQTSMLFLEQNKAFMSTTSSQEAITSLNIVTMNLLAACQQCQQGGSGQGQQAMQQLMSGQQQMIQKSQQMLQMQAAQERMLQEQLAGMQRLAQQQRSLQELAKEIEKDATGKDRPLGRMDKMIEQMEEVIRDLEAGNLSDETIRKEQQILSRMLDAQRSIHTRDYEKKRESMTADELYSEVVSPGSQDKPEQELREEIRRAMMLKAPGEFEDLIKLYFRALAEETP